jgi:formylmethanofuran dehydrogenase subunit E
MFQVLDSALEPYIAQLSQLHDDVCPRQILGVRMALLAGERLGLDVPQPDKRLLAFVETDGCFADGVAVASGCRVGRRTMRVVDYGKVAVTFVDTLTERGLRVWPRPGARQAALAYAPDACDQWHAQRDGYARMPVSELLMAQTVSIAIPVEQIVSRPGLRLPCQACGEEIMNAREVKMAGRTLCRACAGERYYHPLG